MLAIFALSVSAESFPFGGTVFVFNETAELMKIIEGKKQPVDCPPGTSPVVWSFLEPAALSLQLKFTRSQREINVKVEISDYALTYAIEGKRVALSARVPRMDHKPTEVYQFGNIFVYVDAFVAGLRELRHQIRFYVREKPR